MNAMNIKETYKWLEENTNLMQDTMMLDFECLAHAVKTKILFAVDDKHFIPGFFSNSWGEYQVEEVYKVPDEIIKSEMLLYPIRLKAKLLKATGDYQENTIECHSTIDLAIQI